MATNKIALLVPHDRGPTGIGHAPAGKKPFQKFSATFPVYEWSPERIKKAGKRRGKVADASKMMLNAAADVTKKFAATIRPPADSKIIRRDNTKRRLEQTGGGRGAMEGAAGAVFEAGMALALGMEAAKQDTGRSRGDFDLRPKPYGGTASTNAWGAAMSMFGGRFNIADFKISGGGTSRESMASKIAKELVERGPGAKLIRHTPGHRMSKKGRVFGWGEGEGRSSGFVPNFAPITDAVGRELQAGVPASAIRVGNSPALRSAGNPGGVWSL